MNRNKMIFLLIALIVSTSYSQIPYDKYCNLSFGLATDGASGLWGNFVANREDEYVKRFGAYPLVMIWDDFDQYNNIQWRFGLLRKSNMMERGSNIPEPAWGYNLTWDDVRQYLHWKIVSVKTGEIRYFNVKQGNGTDLVSDTTSFGNWFYRLNFNADEWEVPNDGSAWNLSMVFYEGEPETGKLIYESDSYPVIRTNRETPLDTLRWVEHRGDLHTRPQLALRLLEYFPNSRHIYKKLFSYYYSNSNCDSMKWAAREYIRIMKERSDPHYVEYFMSSDEPATRQRPIREGDYVYFETKIQKVCGDTIDWGDRTVPVTDEKPHGVIIE